MNVMPIAYTINISIGYNYYIVWPDVAWLLLFSVTTHKNVFWGQASTSITSSRMGDYSGSSYKSLATYTINQTYPPPQLKPTPG